MSYEELRAVEDFKIFNSLGMIEFPGATDLTDVDLERDITIKKSSIDVYPDDGLRPPTE